jgi:hypothetical protein
MYRPSTIGATTAPNSTTLVSSEYYVVLTFG